MISPVQKPLVILLGCLVLLCDGKEGGVPCDAQCSSKVKLPNISDQPVGEDNIFIIESSPREVLSSRVGCALESAARNSGLHVVMVRVGELLDLRDNTTCQLYTRFRETISFYHIDPVQFSEDTPLQGFFQSGRLDKSMNKFVHIADVLRVLLVYKFGGFYFDSDFVILSSLTGLRNVVASDQVSDGDKFNDNNELLVGNSVTNAMFHFSRGAPILQLALAILERVYDPYSWTSVGPDLLQRSLLTQCGYPLSQPLRSLAMTREQFSRERCGGVQLLDYKSFFPVGWMNQGLLRDPKRRKSEWYEMFQHSYGVHFYHSSSQSARVGDIRSPRHYGARRPAYLTLALDHCPVSYWSKDNSF